MKKLLACLSILFSVNAFADNFSGKVFENVSSDNVDKAKIMAFNEARRQIVFDVLKKYSNSNDLQTVINKTSSKDLVDMVSASSVENEKFSDTTYSAIIHMTIDPKMAQIWMNSNGIDNWLSNNPSTDTREVMVYLSNRLMDWIELKRVLISLDTDLGTKYIMGSQLLAEIPADKVDAFVSKIKELGWNSDKSASVIKIWK